MGEKHPLADDLEVWPALVEPSIGEINLGTNDEDDEEDEVDEDELEQLADWLELLLLAELAAVELVLLDKRFSIKKGVLVVTLSGNKLANFARCEELAAASMPAWLCSWCRLGCCMLKAAAAATAAAELKFDRKLFTDWFIQVVEARSY